MRLDRDAIFPGDGHQVIDVRCAFVDHLVRRFGRTPYWEHGL
jgi:hypothetical protein